MMNCSEERRHVDDDADRCRKRPRYMQGWESCLTNLKDGIGLGLSDLFGGGNTSSACSSSDSTVSSGSSFFKLRLEHREGGAVSRHVGEERILLFRSDRPGAIAKIIYSSELTDAPFTINNKTEDNEEETRSSTAQAKIHVLNVKDQYRGFDLGSLLFTEAIASLRHRYMDEPEDGDDDSFVFGKELQDDKPVVYTPSSIHCQLDAEEDLGRHNKLVGFYEKLGCQVKPKAKILYLNNNDGETYRKVAMQIDLKVQKQQQPRESANEQPAKIKNQNAGSMLRLQQGFVPVVLFESSGKRASGLPFTDKVDWLMMEDDKGQVEFRTTRGYCLRFRPDGCCTAVITEDELVDQDAKNGLDSWSKFRISRISDFRDDSVMPDEAWGKALWVLTSVSHGLFLTVDSDSHLLHCTQTPHFWQADHTAFSLTSTSDTPLRRQHYRKQWMTQTVDFVRRMRERYLEFNLKRMSLLTALELARKLPACHFTVEKCVTTASLRTRCFQSAESFRNAGHPDWVQLVALVHGLAGVVSLIDNDNAIAADDYDWSVGSRARVVGCSAPQSAIFSEFRSLNPDERDPCYSSLQGMYETRCGLDNVLLTWTGPEYLYFLMKYNEVNMPDEGLKMLRLASLYDWHTKGSYAQFANDDDQDMQSFVADFDELNRVAKEEMRYADYEMTSEECTRLWKTHYASIASKYGVDGELQW